MYNQGLTKVTRKSAPTFQGEIMDRASNIASQAGFLLIHPVTKHTKIVSMDRLSDSNLAGLAEAHANGD
jgi:hypothetical protein